MNTWLFQGNPNSFNIDGFLATWPAELPWLVTRYANEINPGDRVFIWRTRGGVEADAGIVAEAVVVGGVEPRLESPAAHAFWQGDSRGTELLPRALLRLIRVATKREVLLRKWLKEDPALRDLPNLKMAAGTNYPVSSEQGARLSALWSRTGRDWVRDEAVAGLWAYAKTYGAPVSKLEGSPVAVASMLIGRPITGVYNKVMNFRAIDPREPRAGLSAGSDTDRVVWSEFYDLEVGQIRIEKLEEEFDRLWHVRRDVGYVEAIEAKRDVVASLARRFETEGLDALLRRYDAFLPIRPALPLLTSSEDRSYVRDPLVVAIARLRARHRCEMPNCFHPPFVTEDGRSYCEVHHVRPLADGGEDTIENVVCLCPSHHREVHLGKEREVLRLALRSVRFAPGNAPVSDEAGR